MADILDSLFLSKNYQCLESWLSQKKLETKSYVLFSEYTGRSKVKGINLTVKQTLQIVMTIVKVNPYSVILIFSNQFIYFGLEKTKSSSFQKQINTFKDLFVKPI
jgi:hypothetical protein